MLTSDEVEAAVLGAQWVAGRGDPALARAARALIAKIAVTVPEKLRPVLLEPAVASAPMVTADLPMRPEIGAALIAGWIALRHRAAHDPVLTALLGGAAPSANPSRKPAAVPALPAEPLARLADELAAVGHGLIMVMGKGGVGKTTIAAALAVGLVQRGHNVHLTTTDPAAHVADALNSRLDGLKVGRIDPKAETEAYIAKIMATRGKALDEQGKALLLEDLQSPCTEEVAVFHAFSRVVNEARTAFVVLDTAPTGHSLLLMDVTGAYHRQMVQQYEGKAAGVHIITPLMRLQDPSMTRVIIVTLPEVTPVSQAAALQDDLKRAQIEPWAWVINKSIAASGTTDPLLQARLAGEIRQTERIANGLAKRTFMLPWLPESPVGVVALGALVSEPVAAAT
jgi:arsenite-transporting ATPase